eukprot:11055245-Alexandrium_andersonii.AAC.1
MWVGCTRAPAACGTRRMFAVLLAAADGARLGTVPSPCPSRHRVTAGRGSLPQPWCRGSIGRRLCWGLWVLQPS